MTMHNWRTCDLIRETLRGKSIYPILMNWRVAERCRGLRGVIVDLGSGTDASYRRYWDIGASRLIRVDLDPRSQPDVVADLNKPLPLPDKCCDHVIAFNVLYTLRCPETLLAEAHRVLKAGGVLWTVTPLIFPEAPEPTDYYRFTSEGLRSMFRMAGFSNVNITPLGEQGHGYSFLGYAIGASSPAHSSVWNRLYG